MEKSLRKNYLLKVEFFANNRLKEDPLKLLVELEAYLCKTEKFPEVLGLFLKLQDKLNQIKVECKELAEELEPLSEHLFNLEIALNVRLEKTIDLKQILNDFLKKIIFI